MEKTLIVVALVALIPCAVFGESCFSCFDNLTPGNCSSLQGVDITTCPVGEAGCYRLKYQDGRVNRGCVSSLTETEASSCRTGSDDCETCIGDFCNARNDPFRICHRCDGIDCPQVQGGTENLYVCNNPLDECGINIVNGLTIRGCAQEINMPATCNALTCNRCSGHLCNGFIFPANRLQCNRCMGTSEECFNEITDLSHRRVCSNYVVSNDQCYSALDNQRQVIRGCLSDGGVGAAACTSGIFCHSCFQTGCNTIAIRPSAQLSCIQCNTNDPNCAWGFPAANATRCVNPVFIDQTESCIERVMWDGTVQRGCTLDTVGTCAESDDTCSTCTGDACNRFSHRAHTCYQCRSSNNESCRTRVEEDLEAETCRGNDHSLSDQGCYTLLQDSGHVVRGCLHNLDTDLLAECRAGQRCQVCDEDSCNVEPFVGGAGALKALSVAMLAIVAVCVHLF